MSDNDLFYHMSMIMNIDQAEIAKIVNDYIERNIGCGTVYDRLNCPKPPIYIGPVKVKSLKQRLEEATMHADCEDCIKRDICTRDVPKPCKYRYTEEERIADQASDMFGAILHKTYLHPTFRKKKEETKMKATSTENFHDIIAIDLELQTFPNPDVQDKFIVSATNRDDIFCFVFEGPHIVDTCRRAGLFTNWEKGQKIRELEEENNQNKKTADTWLNAYYDLSKKFDKLKEKKDQKIRELEANSKDISNDNALLLETNKKLKKEKEEYEDKIEDLQHKYNLEKAANEAQHKFFREYAGKGTEIEFNYAIGDDDEATYVIVDKEEYKALKNIQNNVKNNSSYSAMIHGKVYNPAQLVDRVLELEALKTPTIENFADEEPSSRRDILRCAEKCVCGKREQDYGTPESNFQLIADLWNDYLFNSSKNDITITPTDVAMFMALMKIARIRNGGGSGDSFVDLAGYAACGGEIWHTQNHKDQK